VTRTVALLKEDGKRMRGVVASYVNCPKLPCYLDYQLLLVQLSTNPCCKNSTGCSSLQIICVGERLLSVATSPRPRGMALPQMHAPKLFSLKLSHQVQELTTYNINP
jgi:hypothetical protein